MRLRLLLFFLASFLFFAPTLTAQTTFRSDEYNIRTAEMYGIVGKYEQKVLFYSYEKGRIQVWTLDDKLHKIKESEIKLDRPAYAQLIEIVASKTDFRVIYQYEKKGHHWLKIHRYDPAVRLLDSATVCDMTNRYSAPKITFVLAEDKAHALLHFTEDYKNLYAFAVNLDSSKLVWQARIQPNESEKIDIESDLQQVLFTNQVEMYVAFQLNNRRSALDKHQLVIKKVTNTAQLENQVVPLPDFTCQDIRFAYNHLQQRLIAVGVYGRDNGNRSQGYFWLQLFDNKPFQLVQRPFTDEQMTRIEKKKIVNGKGIIDLKIQQLVFRRDGGLVFVAERVQEIKRSATTTTTTGNAQLSDPNIRVFIDYYHEDLFVASIHADGTEHWQTVLYKKQVSFSDDAMYSSFFVMKSTTGLRLLYNDAAERETTVSEYLLNPEGEQAHHIVLNTKEQDIQLRMRDALQVSANEIIIPSEIRSRIRLLRLVY
jgi:hypothetical protein